MPYGRILLVDEDASLRKLVIDHLEKEGMECCGFSRFDDVVFKAASKADVMIISAGVAGDLLTAVIKRLDSIRSVPIIITASACELSERSRASGVAVYTLVTKPFDAVDVAKMVSGLIKEDEKYEPYNGDHVQYGGLRVDIGAYSITVDGKEKCLTPKEIELLFLLLTKPRHVFSRGELTSRVWGVVLHDSRTVAVHINHIKKKIGCYAACIKTVRGVGYSFIPEE